jgi:hypothetical protein
VHFDEFERIYPQKYEKQYGFWRKIIRSSINKFVKCGDLKEGFARLKFKKCGEEMRIVSFIERRQTDVIERILKHCNLWKNKIPRSPPQIAMSRA